MNFRKLWLVLIALCYLLPQAPAFAVDAGDVVVVPLSGQVSQAQFFFLRRAIKEAESAGASGLILDMDTPGGELGAATKMLDALFKTTLPTVTYVNPNAGSAGALISLSTKKVYMAPVSAIGAAAPVVSGGGDLPSTMSDKVISYYSGYFRSAAERNGYDPAVAEAFINKEKEVKHGELVISEKGELLTLSAQEAARVVNGRPVLASGIAENLEEVARMAGMNGKLTRIEPAGFEQLSFWLTTLAPLFLLGGIVGTYIEIKTPGFGIPGAVAGFCFLVFFTSHYIAGLAGSEVIAIFVLGVVLILIELLVLPGLILPGLIGGMLLIGSVVWAMVDRYPNQPVLPTAEMLVQPAVNMSIAVLLGVVVISVLAKFLPQTVLYRRAMLQAVVAGDAPARVDGRANLIGLQGVAETDLRPSGRAVFGDQLVDVASAGDYVMAGTPVRAVRVSGAQVVVEPA